jgi:hypothetical protein
MKWKKEGKFGVICINPIPIPNPQSTIPNPSTRNSQKFSPNLPSIFNFFKFNLKKLKRWGLWIGIHGFGLKIGWGSNL